MRNCPFVGVLAVACLGLACAASPASAQEIRDPMRPPTILAAPSLQEAAPEQQALILQATRVSGVHRSAVINGMNVRIGDMVGGSRVVAINAGAVQLINDQNETVILEFAPRGMKIPSGSVQ